VSAGAVHIRFNRFAIADVQHAPRSRITRHGVYLVGPRWAYLFIWFHLGSR